MFKWIHSNVKLTLDEETIMGVTILDNDGKPGNTAMADALGEAIKENKNAVTKPVVTQQVNKTIPKEVKKETKPMSNFLSKALGTNFASANRETLQVLVREAAGVLSTISSDVAIDLKPVLIQNNKLNFPVLAVVATHGGKHSVYTIIIEQFSKEIAPRTYSNEQKSITVRKVTSHGYDDMLQDVMSEQLKNQGYENVDFVSFHVFDRSNPVDNIEAISIHVSTAALRLASELTGKGSLPLKAAQDQGYRLHSNVAIVPGTNDTTILGRPVSTDVVSNVTLNTATQNNEESVHTDESVINVLKSNAYVDVIATTPKNKQHNGGTRLTQTAFKTMLVINNIEGMKETGASFEDPKSVLLSVASFMPFIEGDNHKQVHNRTVRGGTKPSVGVVTDYHNCDPLVNTPAKVKVAETHDQANDKAVSPFDIIDDYYEGGMPIVAVEAIKGDRTWSFLEVFVQEATGSVMEQKLAREAILRHIDEQGDGTFSSLWGDRQIMSLFSMAHSGTITPSDGVAYDLAQVDNYRILEACGGDTALASSVMRANRTNVNEEEVLDAQYNFKAQLGAINHRAYSLTLVFDPEFLVAYAQYLSSSKVGIKYDGIATQEQVGLSSGFGTSAWDKSFHMGSAFQQSGVASTSTSQGYGFKV